MTVGGPISPHPDPYARKRYLQRNPKAKLYSPFTDFAIYRMRVEAVHFNGGFGRADPLTPADILAPDGDAAALVEAEDRLLEEVNAFGGAIMCRLAANGDPGRRVWRAVGLDAEGLDLAAGGAGGAGRFQRARVRSAKLARTARGSADEGRGLKGRRLGALRRRQTAALYGDAPCVEIRQHRAGGLAGERAQRRKVQLADEAGFQRLQCACGAARTTRKVFEIAEEANAIGCGRRRGQKDRRRQTPGLVNPANSPNPPICDEIGGVVGQRRYEERQAEPFEARSRHSIRSAFRK